VRQDAPDEVPLAASAARVAAPSSGSAARAAPKSKNITAEALLGGVGKAGYEETGLTCLSTADFSSITPRVKSLAGGLRRVPRDKNIHTGLRDQRHVIFDDGQRLMWATTFENEWDPYFDDFVQIGLERHDRLRCFDARSGNENRHDGNRRRQRCSRPVLDELQEWIARQKALTPPKTPLGKALGYIDRQWARLLLFLALDFVVGRLVRRDWRGLLSPLMIALVRCGENPLAPYCFAVLLSFIGLVVLKSVSAGVLVQSSSASPESR